MVVGGGRRADLLPARIGVAASGRVRGSKVHLRVFQLADQIVDQQGVGAHRLRFRDLPVALRVLAELDCRAFAGESYGSQLVLIESQKPLVAQVVDGSCRNCSW